MQPRCQLDTLISNPFARVVLPSQSYPRCQAGWLRAQRIYKSGRCRTQDFARGLGGLGQAWVGVQFPKPAAHNGIQAFDVLLPRAATLSCCVDVCRHLLLLSSRLCCLPTSSNPSPFCRNIPPPLTPALSLLGSDATNRELQPQPAGRPTPIILRGTAALARGILISCLSAGRGRSQQRQPRRRQKVLKSRNNGGQAGNRPAVKSEIPPIKSRKGGVGVVCGVQVGVGVGADADAGGGRGEKKKTGLAVGRVALSGR